MDRKIVDEVIREIKDFTNLACARDPQSYVPVVAKSAIALLEDMKDE